VFAKIFPILPITLPLNYHKTESSLRLTFERYNIKYPELLVQAFRHGSITKKNLFQHGYVKLFVFLLSWLIFEVIFLVIKLSWNESFSRVYKEGICIYSNTPNQLKTLHRIQNILPRIACVKIFGPFSLLFANIKVLSIGIGLPSFSNIVQSLKRLISFFAFSIDSTHLKNVSIKHAASLGAQYSLAFERFFKLGLHGATLWPKIISTSPQYWVEVISYSFARNNKKSYLVLHGSIGNPLEYRSVMNYVHVDNDIDALCYSYISQQAFISYEKKIDIFSSENDDSGSSQKNLLVCTNFLHPNLISSKELNQKYFSECAKLFEIVKTFSTKNNLTVFHRKHPRENYLDYGRIYNMKVHEFTSNAKINPTIVITTRSSVVFEYLSLCKVFMYSDCHPEELNRLSSIDLICQILGFTDYNTLKERLQRVTEAGTHCQLQLQNLMTDPLFINDESQKRIKNKYLAELLR